MMNFLVLNKSVTTKVKKVEIEREVVGRWQHLDNRTTHCNC